MGATLFLIVWFSIIGFFLYWGFIRPYIRKNFADGLTESKDFYEGPWWNKKSFPQILQYKLGKRNGVCKTFYTNGAIRYFDIYNNDQLILRKAFDQDGRFLFEEDYEKLGVAESTVTNKVKSRQQIKEEIDKIPRINFEENDNEVDLRDKEKSL